MPFHLMPLKPIFRLALLPILSQLLGFCAYALPTQALVPGGIAIVPLERNYGEPHFKFQNRKVLVTEDKGEGFAVVGLPLSLKPGEHFISGHYGNKKSLVKKFFTVKDKTYTTQHITIKDKRKVNPYEKDMARIQAERKRKRKAARHWNDQLPDLDFLTPVDGIMTGDPRIIDGAKTIPTISYDEAAELAYFGAKVVHPFTILPAVKKEIPVWVRNTSRPESPGTRITGVSDGTGVRAVASKCGVTLVTVRSSRMLNAYGFLQAIFAVFARNRVSVDLVATSEVSVSMEVTR